MRPLVVTVPLILGILLLLGGGMGGLHPAGDSLGVFRMPGAAGVGLLALAALASGAQRLGALGLVMALLAAGPAGLEALSSTPARGDLRLYQKNLLFRNADLKALAADIRAAAPDAVTLQEVSGANKVLLADLAGSLPHQLWCPFASVGGTAVASRLPPVPDRTLCAPGLAAMQVQASAGRVWIVSIHLHWPWPHRQPEQVAELLPLIEGLEGPVVIGGDFNMVARSATLRRFARTARARLARPERGTYLGFAPLLRLPIDHVLSPGGGQIEVRPALGSDHLGLVASLSLRAP